MQIKAKCLFNQLPKLGILKRGDVGTKIYIYTVEKKSYTVDISIIGTVLGRQLVKMF